MQKQMEHRHERSTVGAFHVLPSDHTIYRPKNNEREKEGGGVGGKRKQVDDLCVFISMSFTFVEFAIQQVYYYMYVCICECVLV